MDEYRQQKEAERAEMKRVMMEKKRQLRSKSVDVLVVPDNTEASTESSTPSSMKTTNNRMRPTMYVSGIYGDSEDDSSRASAPINGNIENQDEDGIDVLNAGLNETVNGKKLSDSMPAWEDKSSPVNNEIGDDVAQQDDYNEDEFSGIEFRTLDFEVIDGEIAAEGEVNGPISIDEKVAMEYSMMLQQMQDILQLPSVYKAPENIGDAPSPIIEDDDEFEEDSPDEVSGSEDKSFGEPSLSDESSLDPMNETASLKDLNKPQDEEFAYDGGEKVAVLRKNAPTGDDEEEEKLGMEIKSLRSYLISKVGHRNLRDAMQFLSFIHLHENEEVDDDRLLTDLEELIGSDNLQYLDDMFRLMTLEEM